MKKKENAKILIVCFSNLRSVPYISSYTNILDNNNLKYDVVYWKRYNIDEEIADVLWVLLCIANQTGVDITTAFQKSMDKKTKRDNKRHINNPKLNDHGGE